MDKTLVIALLRNKDQSGLREIADRTGISLATLNRVKNYEWWDVKISTLEKLREFFVKDLSK